MSRLMTVLWLFFTLFTALITYLTSHQVEQLGKKYTRLEKTIVQTQETIHVLEAEWSYLNEPERLHHLSKKFLDLHPVQTHQIKATAYLSAHDPRWIHDNTSFKNSLSGQIPTPPKRPNKTVYRQAIVPSGMNIMRKYLQ